MRTSAPADRFLSTLRRRYWLWNTGIALAANALPIGVALCVVELAAPRWTRAAAAAGIAWLVVVAVATPFRLRLRVADADRQLGLGDRLLTWVGLRERAHPPDPGFAQWLRADLETRLVA